MGDIVLIISVFLINYVKKLRLLGDDPRIITINFFPLSGSINATKFCHVFGPMIDQLHFAFKKKKKRPVTFKPLLTI